VNRDEVAAYCLAKPGAEETYPWGEGDLVVKVGGKSFAFLGIGGTRETVSLKCGRDQETAREWRDRWPDAVVPSPYLARYGWNSVTLDGTVAADDLRDMIDGSYDDVVARLPRSKRPPAPAE
jgi:predicted DNA-binding protein (MmcQ/YjbR family)